LVFAKVHDILLKHLKSHKLDDWLPKAKETYEGQRLAICLAIDLEMGTVAATDVDLILESFTAKEPDVCQHFFQAVDRHPDRARLRGLKSRSYDPPDGDTYTRVLQLASYVTHYLADFEYSLDLTDLAEVQEEFFPDDLLKTDGGVPLGYVRNYWTGRNDITWVTAYSEVLGTARRDPERMAGALNDALGLGFSIHGDSIPVLVAVKYPARCDIKCRKPNSFVADWSTPAGYYLSSGEVDDWGMTESCTGDFSGQRERIHDGFRGLSDQFVGYLVGPIDDIVGDFPRLIEQGLRRLEACVRSA